MVVELQTVQYLKYYQVKINKGENNGATINKD